MKTILLRYRIYIDIYIRTHIYYLDICVCIYSISSHVIWKLETFIEGNIRNIAHWTMIHQSPSKEASWDLTRFSQLPSAVLSYFLESHWQPGISSLPKMIWVLDKTRSCKAPNLGCRGLSHLVFWYLSKRLHKTWCVSQSVVEMTPAAHSRTLLNYPNSFHSGMFKVPQNLMQIHCFTCSVILNAMATQYMCSLKGVYHLHWRAQWSCHCSHMCIPVHSPWLPDPISVAQAILLLYQ